MLFLEVQYVSAGVCNGGWMFVWAGGCVHMDIMCDKLKGRRQQPH